MAQRQYLHLRITATVLTWHSLPKQPHGVLFRCQVHSISIRVISAQSMQAGIIGSCCSHGTRSMQTHSTGNYTAVGSQYNPHTDTSAEYGMEHAMLCTRFLSRPNSAEPMPFVMQRRVALM